MNTEVTLAVLAILAVALLFGAWFYVRHARSKRLKSHFGPEYDLTVERLHDPELAEAELKEREKRVKQFTIVPLPQAECDRYQRQWLSLQTDFVDHPEKTVAEADALVREVMERRGYPVTEFEQLAADLSVHHPRVVENYRAAHAIAERSRQGAASTEELRQALVYYRALFQDLLVSREKIRDAKREGRRDRSRILAPWKRRKTGT